MEMSNTEGRRQKWLSGSLPEVFTPAGSATTGTGQRMLCPLLEPGTCWEGWFLVKVGSDMGVA